jgi:hypothetical protein
MYIDDPALFCSPSAVEFDQQTYSIRYYDRKSCQKSMTPEDLLKAQVEEFNKDNLSFLTTLYENDACFASGRYASNLPGFNRHEGKIRS